MQLFAYKLSAHKLLKYAKTLTGRPLLAAFVCSFSILCGGLSILPAQAQAQAQAQESAAPVQVTIAAYEFPPFYSQHMTTHVLGELVTSLNNFQNDYLFSIRQVPVTARYQALLDDGCCDLMMFESPQWGWQQYLQPAHGAESAIQATRALLAGAERLVAKRAENIDFQQLNNIRLGGIRGYHYSFSDELPETGALESGAGIYFADSIATNIKLVLSGRLDRMMLSDAYLASIANTPLAEQLVWASHADSRYQLHMLVNENKAMSVKQLDSLLESLRRSGEWEALLRQFNLNQFELSADTQASQ